MAVRTHSVFVHSPLCSTLRGLRRVVAVVAVCAAVSVAAASPQVQTAAPDDVEVWEEDGDMWEEFMTPHDAMRQSAGVQWSHLPTHRRGTMALLQGDAPPGASGLQPAYSWNNFKDGGGAAADGSDTAQRPIAYGGILNRHTRQTVTGAGVQSTCSHAGVLSALRVALGVVPTDIAASDVARRVWGNRTVGQVAIATYAVQDAFTMPLHVTPDGATPYRGILRMVRPVRPRMELRVDLNMTVGTMFWLRVRTEVGLTAAPVGDAAGEHGPDAADPSTLTGVTALQHEFAVYLDLSNDWYVHQHTFTVEAAPAVRDAAASVEVTVDADGNAQAPPALEADEGPAALALAVYNVWNTNPPPWLYGRPQDRWAKYLQRMELLAAQLRDEAPDVIAFQEVRFDTSLGADGQHSQLRHLLKLLPGFQYVWQPANVYVHPETFPSLDQEGCAIFSRHPIVYTDHTLLSRDAGDRQDEHQRVVLHACVQLPDGTLVDVYTTHLSLSERARDRTVPELWQFVQQSRRGHVQVVTGDMNAEPDTQAIQFLQGLAAMADAAGGVPAALTDAWLLLHPEPAPRSTDEAVRRDALTFPSDDPVKRIDLVLVGSPDGTAAAAATTATATAGADDDADTGSLPPCVPVVHEVYLIGQEPLSGVGAMTGSKGEHLGMVHRNSRVWASDHRGVVTKLMFRRTPDCAEGGATAH